MEGKTESSLSLQIYILHMKSFSDLELHTVHMIRRKKSAISGVIKKSQLSLE